MFPRVSAIMPLRLLSRVPLCSSGSETPVAAIMRLGAPLGTVRYGISALLAPKVYRQPRPPSGACSDFSPASWGRCYHPRDPRSRWLKSEEREIPERTKNKVQRYFGTNNVVYNKKDEQSAPTQEISKEAETQERVKENTKKDLLGIIKGMKVELSTVNVQTTKPSSRRQPKGTEAVVGGLLKAPQESPKKRTKSLSPELVAATAAVADVLPLDKQVTKSELLRQLQLHEEVSKAQKDGERAKISISNIISDMKIAKSATARVRSRPVHQIQFDEGSNDYMGPKETDDLKKSLRKNIFKGKRLNIFDLKAVTEAAPETETTPSLWDVEFAKQLAKVNEQPLQNGFEEMIQWTKEGKLWEFPINNEAGFDDDGSEFHEHIFLDKYLEDFPKQGPIRHFMELVTCGLSKNPYLSVKQKVEHIEWFRNYFNEKQDILRESGIQFS